MISKKLAIEVLNLATSTGADFAEIYLEEDKTISINIDNCKVEGCSDALTYGAGIRLLKGLQSVYGYTNDISRKGLSKLATSLAASFSSERCVEVTSISKVRVSKNHRPQIEYSTYSKEKIIDMLNEAS